MLSQIRVAASLTWFASVVGTYPLDNEQCERCLEAARLMKKLFMKIQRDCSEECMVGEPLKFGHSESIQPFYKWPGEYEAFHFAAAFYVREFPRS